MKHRKILSVLLALVMVLALTVPAMADETSDWNWNFEVAGKSDEEISVGEKTFKLRNWAWSDEDENGTCTVTKEADVSEYTASQLVILKKGDTAVITNGGEQFDSLELSAWSDPDGDGVYDQRLMKVSLSQEEKDSLDESITPADLAGPLTSGEFFGDIPWYFSGCVIQIDGTLDSGEGMIGDGAELRLSADALLEKFGGNTLLFINPRAEDSGWAVLLEGGATQPAEAGTYTVKYGDTWGQIALNNYGTYAAWKQLWKANGYKGLSTGKDIVLPEKLGSYTRLAAQVLAEGEKLYTVKAGDTLGQIAVAAYKDINMYKAIFERNADRLKNANSIYEGQVIVLPVKSAK